MRLWLAGNILDYGLRCVERYQFGRAELCVRLLRALRNTGEHELAAKIAFQQRDPERAVELLRGPADRHPRVWILNSLLGQAFSDQGAYAAARERFWRVYETAKPRGAALFNLAIVAQREGNHEESLELLDRSVAEGEPVVRPAAVEEVRAAALMRLERLDEAEAILRAAPHSDQIQSTLALTLALMGREEEAWEAVKTSFREEPGMGYACEATRVLLDNGSPVSRKYKLMLEGVLDPDRHILAQKAKAFGFFTTAWINADDEAEALAIARRVEPDLLDLQIDESTWEPPGEDKRRGYVARRRGHTLYRKSPRE